MSRIDDYTLGTFRKVVSKFGSSQCRSFGVATEVANRRIHFYIYRIYIDYLTTHTNYTISLDSIRQLVFVMNKYFVARFLALLGYYATQRSNYVPTFRDNLSVTHSRVMLKMGLIGCPKPSARTYHSTLRVIPEEFRSQVFCFL
jgi:hypothetical protein